MDKVIQDHIEAAKEAGLVGTAELIQSLFESKNRLNDKLQKEMSKNAYVSVTGKSIKAIWSDGIIDAIEALSPDYDENSVIKVVELLEHSLKLAHQ